MASTTRQIVDGVLLPLEVQEEPFNIYLEKWQNLLYEAANIEEEDISDDTKWPYLFRLLISYLIVRDLVYGSLNQHVIGPGYNSGAGSGSSSDGSIKKIETGPVNVERFDKVKSAAAFFAVTFNKSGLWEEILAQICMLASRLEVYISGCEGCKPGPIKVIRGSDYAYEDQYPNTPASNPKP